MSDKINGFENIDEYFLAINQGKVYDVAVSGMEKKVIEKVLQRCRGNQIEAAKFLGINRNTLRTKIKKLNIDIDSYKF